MSTIKHTLSALSSTALLLGVISLDATANLIETHTLNNGAHFEAVAFSSDSSKLYSGDGDRSLTEWDAHSGRELHNTNIRGYGDRILGLSVSPDGSNIAISSDDPSGNKTAIIWNLRKRAIDVRLRGAPQGECGTITYDEKGEKLAIGCWDSINSDGTLQVWNARSGAPLQTKYGVSDPVIISSDGTRVGGYEDGGGFAIIDVRNGRQLMNINVQDVTSSDYSSDSRQIVTGDSRGTITIWNARNGNQIKRLTGHRGEVWSLKFSPDMRYLVSGGDDQTLRLWDVASGNLLSTENMADVVYSVAISPDSTKVAGAAGADIKIFDLGGGPPTKAAAGLAGKWQGPKGVSYVLKANGADFDVLDGGTKIALVQVSGNSVTLVTLSGLTRGTLNGKTIKWANFTSWTRQGRSTGSTKPADVSGAWTGPNGEAYDLQQSGTNVTIRSGSKTVARVTIAGKTITWGGTKGTVNNKSIRWSNNTSWNRDVVGINSPPSKNAANIAGAWTGPNGEAFNLQQSGNKITVREGNKTVSTAVTIAGNTVTWGTVKGNVNGKTINWTNGTIWTRPGNLPGNNPPGKKPANVAGAWTGPNGATYNVLQRGTKVTVRDGNKTLSSTVTIAGNTLRWGITKGTLSGNTIRWSNNTNWTRQSGVSTIISQPPTLITANVSGEWEGPGGQTYNVQQRGNKITVREGNKTLSTTVTISGTALKWGTTKGTLNANTIRWSNNTNWKRKRGSTNIISNPPGNNAPAINVSGAWYGPGGKIYSMQQSGTSITVRDGSKVIATVTIAGNTLTWGTTTGTLRGKTIRWSNNTTWSRNNTNPNQPPNNRVNVAGSWTGPNGESYVLTQNGSRVVIKQHSRTLATVTISAQTITWGGVKGTVTGNNIRWTNNTNWSRNSNSTTSTGSIFGNLNQNQNVTRYETIRCKSKLFLFHNCGVRGAKTVELVKQRSMVVCAKGQSYGLDSNGLLWVDKGCNATFKLGY